jgi:hypothetical protein
MHALARSLSTDLSFVDLPGKFNKCLRPQVHYRYLYIGLQLIAVHKARTEKLPFWAIFEFRDRFAHISVSSAPIELKHG